MPTTEQEKCQWQRELNGSSYRAQSCAVYDAPSLLHSAIQASKSILFLNLSAMRLNFAEPAQFSMSLAHILLL